MNVFLFICVVSECDARADVVFVVDASGSIRNERFFMIQNYVTNVTYQFNVDPDYVRVGLVIFGDDATKMFDLNTFTMKEDVLLVTMRAFLNVKYHHQGEAQPLNETKLT